MSSISQKITPFLWFDKQAEEAASFYCSIFKNSKVGHIARYGDAGAAASGMPKGTAMTVEFELEGQKFVALNGGPHFKFTEAVSFVVNCKDQAEVDYYWNKLSQGGDEKAQVCGWLKDRFGLSWQIVPKVFFGMINDRDAGRSENVMKAMLQMKKFDIRQLEQAYGS